VEGNVTKNAFRWKQTIGPWENRPGHYGDVWNYWTDDGFGFYEGLLVGILSYKLLYYEGLNFIVDENGVLKHIHPPISEN
jgi:hypothetical protein